MQVVQGVYDNGKITLDRELPVKYARITVIFAYEEKGSVSKKILKSKGAFNHCADLSKIPGEKGAWERAVVEKYAKDHNS